MKNYYIHIGNNRVIKTKDIVGVFDIDTATISKTTRDFLSSEEKNERLFSEFEDLPRSFIISSDVNEIKTYISQQSTAAILRRSKKKKIF